MSSFPPASAFAQQDAVALAAAYAPGHSTPCRIGQTAATAKPLLARIEERRRAQHATAGGLELQPPPNAYILKSTRPAPELGWFFYDGQSWWIIDDIADTPNLPEYRLDLKPLSGSDGSV